MQLFSDDIKGKSVYERIKNGDVKKLIGHETIKEDLEWFWSKYEPICPDENFRSEFAKDGNIFALTWQMVLSVKLKQSGFNILKTKEFPDICIDYEGIKILIEAAMAKAGDPKKDDSAKYTKKHDNGISSGYNYNGVLLRLNNSFREKAKQYKSHLNKGDICKNDPYVIAITVAGDVHCDHMEGGPSVMQQVLFGIGDYKMIVDSNSHEIIAQGFEPKEKIKKSNTSDVEQAYFKSNEYEFVSGVIFCRYFNSGEYEMKNGNRKRLFNTEFIANPHAKNKLDGNIFDRVINPHFDS